MNDTIEYLGKSLIQHGKFNNRIYLMKLASQDYPQIIKQFETIVKEQQYTKIFVKIPQHFVKEFVNAGYILEAEIPGFYKTQHNACFLGKYYSDSRNLIINKEKMDSIITLCRHKKPIHHINIPSELVLTKLAEHHTAEMASVYKEVFQTYPFPIDQPDYLAQTMRSHIDYYGVKIEEKIVALASTEKDCENFNAEMTDFATLPAYRGQNLATYLLYFMEQNACKENIQTAYTIARAYSTGMNVTFAKLGYNFAGTLINNTNICGQLEPMNVWFKTLNNSLFNI